MWISKKQWQQIHERFDYQNSLLHEIQHKQISNARVESDSDPFTITCLATIDDRQYTSPSLELLFGEKKKHVRLPAAPKTEEKEKEKLIAFGFDGLISKQLRSMKSVSMQPDVCIRRIVFFLNAPENVRIVECIGSNISGLASPGGVRFGVCDLSLTPANRLTFTVERR